MGEQVGRPVIEFDGGENRHLHATWSRSGKRMILSLERWGHSATQIELTESQVLEFAQFLLETRESIVSS